MRKSDLWQYQIFNREKDGFKIKNPLLNACVAWDSWLIDNKHCFHGFRKSKWSAGYVVLCALLEESLNIHRYPFTADRIITKCAKDTDIKQELKIHLPDSKQHWNAAVIELKALYQHTQQKLAQHFSDDTEPLILQRVIYDSRDYGNSIHLLKTICEHSAKSGRSAIPLEMDTLNSYMSLPDHGYSYRENDCTQCAIITHQVNVADILYCCSLTAPKTDIEDGEWVVINRNKDGIVHLPVENFKFIPSKIEERTGEIARIFEMATPKHQIKQVWQDAPVYIRPESTIHKITEITPFAFRNATTLRQKLFLRFIKRYFYPKK